MYNKRQLFYTLAFFLFSTHINIKTISFAHSVKNKATTKFLLGFINFVVTIGVDYVVEFQF